MSLPPYPPLYPCTFPPDELGQPCGVDYKPFLLASGGRRATQFSFQSEKTGRDIQCLSMAERAVAFTLEVDPWVCDYREQYVRASDELLVALAKDPDLEIRRNQVFTLDFVITYQTPVVNEFEYEVQNVKRSRADTEGKSIKKRFSKERADAESRSWAWQSVIATELDKNVVLSSYRIWRWAGTFQDRQRQEDIRKLRKFVLDGGGKERLDDILYKAASALHIPLDRAYIWFAMGVCFGFLPVDLAKGVGRELVLHVTANAK